MQNLLGVNITRVKKFKAYSEVPNRRACMLKFFRFFATLLTDFLPARLINLKNISSLLDYSVLLAQQFYQITTFDHS
jgi:hypothetical protein